LCGNPTTAGDQRPSIELEAIRRELNDRIDQIGDATARRTLALQRTRRELQQASATKGELDEQLQQELALYDSAYIESIRLVDGEIATLRERRRSLVQLSEMPRAIGELEERAGALQGRIDRLRTSVEEERQRLRSADENAQAIAQTFKATMLEVGFPGVSADDEVVLDPRNWKPTVVHGGQEWGFWDTGSGGKKTLFNVCYALALHEVARERGMPVPNVLIIDSPTKNISDDENPELVRSLYNTIYRVAADRGTQFLLIDSELVEPEAEVDAFSHRRLAGEGEAPSLISYYVGP
jgi:DNA repair exonuclease SbcCD ATPase subunit